MDLAEESPEIRYRYIVEEQDAMKPTVELVRGLSLQVETMCLLSLLRW